MENQINKSSFHRPSSQLYKVAQEEETKKRNAAQVMKAHNRRPRRRALEKLGFRF